MSFINQFEIDELRSKLLDDPSRLGKLLTAKKRAYNVQSVEHSLVESYIKDGWEVDSVLKTKTKIRKEKSHSQQFEDDIWVQMYKLGFRHLNSSNDFRLHFGKDSKDRKQIDVVAIRDKTVLLFECKSSQESKKAPSYKDEFELHGKRIDGFRKTLEQLLQIRGLKIKYIFATRNIHLNRSGVDFKRLIENKSIHFSDNTYEYLNGLILKYKDAAFYQFYGMIFKGQVIDSEKIEVPAVKGKMGNLNYYMFSIEPEKLLRIGFILHRTRANEEETPTYQRLLVPSRLKGISKFISEGGYFPNSLIVNFTKSKNKIQFIQNAPSPDGSNAATGILKIPNAYSIAYIIDGQHRLYGYAGSKFAKTNSIPVVAFEQLTASDQLKIFMDINENQKAVSPSLRLSLEEDLYWNSERADSRLKALRSSIIRELGETEGPLFKRITLGEDKAKLSSNFFDAALKQSGLLPSAKGNKYDEFSVKWCIYDIVNTEHNDEMIKTRRIIVDLLLDCFYLVKDEYPDIYSANKSLIMTNRGIQAFIVTIGSIHKELSMQGIINRGIDTSERFNSLKKYLQALLTSLRNLDQNGALDLLSTYGSGADKYWSMTFQSMINKIYPDYFPNELEDWNERQNVEIQQLGRKLGVAIEKEIKRIVLNNLKIAFGENWDLEIGAIKRECIKKAEEEKERNYKELKTSRDIPWTDMFTIVQYKTIIQKYWSLEPDEAPDSFLRFSKIFAIDIGLGFHGTKDQIRWLSLFNSYRNNWAHEGTKEKGLNREELEHLKLIYKHFELGEIEEI